MCLSRGFKRGRNRLSRLCFSPMWAKADRFCLWFCGLPWIHKWHLLKLVQLFFRAERRESWELTHNWTECIFSPPLNSGAWIRLDSELPLSLKVLGVDMKPWTEFKMLFVFMLAIHSSGDGIVLLVCIATEGICLEQSDWLWKSYSWAVKCIFSLGVEPDVCLETCSSKCRLFYEYIYYVKLFFFSLNPSISQSTRLS